MIYESIQLTDRYGYPMIVNKYAIRYIKEYWIGDGHNCPQSRWQFKYTTIGLDNTTLETNMRAEEVNARINGTYSEEHKELPPLKPLLERWSD